MNKKKEWKEWRKKKYLNQTSSSVQHNQKSSDAPTPRLALHFSSRWTSEAPVSGASACQLTAAWGGRVRWRGGEGRGGAAGSSGWFLINFPELFLDLGRQGVKEVLLHHQASPLELPALAQLHRQTLQPVAPQLQLRQCRQLAEARRQRLQAVVAQVERAQLLALEQLVGQALDLQRRRGGRRKSGGISISHCQ